MNTQVLSPGRLVWLDTLRGLTAGLVVLFHAALCYVSVAPRWWYVVDPAQMEWAKVPVGVMFDAFLMPVMFWVAGYGGAQGRARAWGEWAVARARRLLLPWALGVAVLVPLMMVLFHVSRHWAIPQGVGLYLMGPGTHCGHLWFLPVLWGYGVLAQGGPGAVAWLARQVQRPYGVAAFLLVDGLVYALGQLFIGPHVWWSGAFLAVEPARLGMYFGFFLLGMAEGLGGEAPRSRFVWAWALALLPLAGVYLLASVNPHWALLNGLSYVGFAWAMLRVLSAVCRRVARAAGGAQRAIGRHAFGVYVLHLPIVLWAAWALRPWGGPATLKWLLVAAAGWGGALGLSMLWRGVRRLALPVPARAAAG